ncbi:MAG: efflux RND transporter periplasmic adaptor subunit [Acinetobacter sp.]|uniref:Efflux RND transporter periplasmic adaptor subunit n=1 Tax=Acinetobacter guillouiae TaxID=106649 RepID=A0A8X8KDW7_ACIGI|nr:efflux RND transporter periplasmic adaptor subunit [Acinetobacter guillouiae]MDN5416660.1 efflux RND transporter periplasmic adaptor subunit [Acinetobacter sp.]MCF0264040.1 efflux RND transporter periplasmic adaptor subunit [Acinetobacter guillouiae]MDN5489035.1 efflux RND transporter periplasmic adaptor subunit [Acinetobacter sp.]MDN5624421.1 efflux RND transporter periplasmic adaptor subunit [Acinetobacter sp.]MDN5649561.1 efflux RND transporter periplasmic adaptor subunit [Acinetobacter 
MMPKPYFFIILLVVLSGSALTGCNRSGNAEAEQAQQAAPAKVSIYTVQQQDIHLIENLPARVQAYRISEIRPQVGGIIEKVLFTQGSEVKAGQPLFKINSEILQADVNSNQALLAKAQAEVVRLKTQQERYRQLLPSNAISKQEFNNTEAAYQQALAEVAQTKAALARQNLNLRYATVRAPISGQIGKLLVTEGALVSTSDTNPMALVHQLDKVYVDVKQSISEYEQLQDRLNDGSLLQRGGAEVSISNSQGKLYPVTGKILFSDTSVDPNTGDVTIRVEVNNPQRKLLPGMYVRVGLNRASQPNALLVPEQAVQRDISGQAQLMIVKANQTAETRPVSLGQLYKGFYVVNSGIKAGEKVIVEGHDRIQQPEQPLKITQWKSQYTTDVGTLQTQNKGSDQSTAGQSSPNTGEKL